MSHLCTNNFYMCARTLTGLGMLVCSMDGTVAYLDFSLDELGDPLSEEEKVRHHVLMLYFYSITENTFISSVKLHPLCTFVLLTSGLLSATSQTVCSDENLAVLDSVGI